MSFWLQESKIKTNLRVIKFRERVIVSSVFLGILTSSIYFKFLQPKKLAIVSNQEILKKLQEKQLILAGIEKEHDQLKVACDELKKKLIFLL